MRLLHGRPDTGWGFLARTALAVPAGIYGVAHSLRRMLYVTGVAPTLHLPCPVISVGNITAGGTGKTPMCELLARKIVARGQRVAILSRGYGPCGTSGADDEAPGSLPVGAARFTHPRRARLARQVLRDFKPDVMVLDDGFQHYAIHRDLDIVLVDALNPFSNNHLLPRGLLRERPSALRRADLIVVTRSNQVDPIRVETLRAHLERLAPGVPVIESIHQPTEIESVSERRTIPLEWLRGRELLAFCGLGNPAGFRKTIEGLGAKLATFVAFPDHHAYSEADVERLNLRAREFMTEAFVTTRKDAAKLSAELFEGPLLVVHVELKLTRGAEALDARIERILGAPGLVERTLQP